MSATANDPNLKHLTKAREQIAKGDLKNAAVTLNKALRESPQDARIFMLGGLLAEKSGNVEGAFKSLRKAVALAPVWGPGLLELALLLARQNQFSEAVKLAEKVALLEPRNLQVLAGVVDIAHRSGHLEMAVRHLRRGLELTPGDVALRQLLAGDLSSLGQHDESIELWTQLVEQMPENPRSLVGRVQARIAAGRPTEMIGDIQVLLAQAPDDAVYRYYERVAKGEVPDEQPSELTRPLFDGMAEFYDLHVVRGLNYQLPKQVADAILARHPDKKINVLDLGCGTGLLGLYLGSLEGALVGVDLSLKMVEQAARHGVYDRFHTANLQDALRDTPEGLYQVVAALDVFIYSGDLTRVIPNAFKILAASGELVFSCELADEAGPNLILQPSGRYAHKSSHVRALCQEAGFHKVDIQNTVLRQENGQPVNGFVVTAHKPA